MTDSDNLYAAAFEAVPVPCQLLDPQLVIVAVNAAYERVLGHPRAALVGRHVSDAFPAHPDDLQEAGALETSLRTALETGRPHRMPLLRYDVASAPGSGESESRWWTLANTPVLGPDGAVLAVLNAVEDVTALVRGQEQGAREREMAQDLRARAQTLQDDLLARSRELASLAASEAVAQRRLTGLAEAALELASADTVAELTDVVVGRGLAALGADGGAIAVRDDARDVLRLTLTDSLTAEAQRTFAELPLDGPLPASVAARTRRPVLLRDRAAGLAFAPEMAQVYATAGKVAWASLPLLAGPRLLGSLSASWDRPQDFTSADVELMSAFAAQCAQALHRVLVRQAERQAATATRRLSEALQHSLLTDPPQPDHLQIAVRYLPAASEAQIGGDWYDAFLVGAGTTCLVIGDVAGHDQDAAAAMAQARNLLRGVAHTLREPPAAVLTGLDSAMYDLAVGALATAVLAQVEQSPADAARGVRVLRWSNAGHPPPLLLHPDGTAQLLTRTPDLLLGLDPSTDRADHTHVLQPGTTLLLYTDGLVERRGVAIDDGLEWLRRRAGALAGLGLEDLCDALLADLVHGTEDDVALLAVRAHPEDRPRPPDAGPERLPSQHPGAG